MKLYVSQFLEESILFLRSLLLKPCILAMVLCSICFLLGCGAKHAAECPSGRAAGQAFLRTKPMRRTLLGEGK